MEPIVIGIAGGTGSGKTTLVNKLHSILGNEFVMLCHDYYYKSFDEMPLEERKKQNYDHPHSFDTDQLIQDIKNLKKGLVIERPVYDFVNYIRKPERIRLEPKKVIVVEGILIFENRQLLEQLDIKVFVDTDADERIIRRIMRDVKERGRSLESVVSQYLSTVKVMHEEFVEPSKRNADVIVPQGGYNEVAVSMLIDKIRTLIHQGEKTDE